MRRRLPIAFLTLTLVSTVPALAVDAPPGWYSGDLHVHWPDNGCVGVADPTSIYEGMPADLNIASVLLWCGGEDTLSAQDLSYFNGRQDAAVSTPNRIVHYDLELSSCNLADRMGHVTYLNLSDVEFPEDTYQGPVQEWARNQGAYVGFDHAQAFAEGPFEFPVLTRCCAPYEAPTDIALDRVDFLIYQPNQDGWRFLWYSLLDCGFRLGMAVTTDAACMPYTVGTHRTYAPVQGDLTYGKFLKSVKDGSVVMVEDGAGFLEFSVDGVGIGDELQLPVADTAVTLEARLTLPGALYAGGTLEIVRNQEVVASQSFAQAGGEVVLTLTEPVDRSSWYVARTEKVHTGAIYVEVEGAPIRASVASANYHVLYQDWFASTVEANYFTQLTPEDKAALLLDIQDAREIFQQIRVEAWQGTPTAAETEARVPLRLRSNAPNPFNPRTSIRFDLLRAGRVELLVFDLAGRKVRTLLDHAPLDRGSHEIAWDGTDDGGRAVVSGTYIYRVASAGYSDTGRMALVQ